MDRENCLFIIWLFTLFSVFIYQDSFFARIIQVGPERTITTPSAAANIAVDGDTIDIDAVEYVADVAAWRQNNLLIRGVGGRPHLRANGNQILGKGTWITIGNNITVENIEFSEASVPDENGAGIRQEGYILTVRNCFFHDNENGILGEGGNVTIEYCEFANNGFGDGLSHNVYISWGDVFTFRFNYSHHTKIGHNVKSRSKISYIEYNRIMDEKSGTSSYAIDIPDGGLTYIIGNLLQQGPFTDNGNAIVSYASESSFHPNQIVYIINNTFVNDYGPNGTHIHVRRGTTAKIQNNIFAGGGRILNGPGNLLNNWIVDDPNFVNISNYDYRLTENSTGAIDQGGDPGTDNHYNLKPLWHYIHPTNRKYRVSRNQIDIGAYEWNKESDENTNSNLFPGIFKLEQNYPNPFNPETYISLQLPSAEYVTIDIFDLKGKRVDRLVDKRLDAGQHVIEFQTTDLESGVYFYTMKTPNYHKTRKMILLK